MTVEPIVQRGPFPVRRPRSAVVLNWCLAGAAVMLVAGCAGPMRLHDRSSSLSPAPIPRDLLIERRGSLGPAWSMRFVGVWHGKWAGTLDSYLVVQQVRFPVADLYFSIGTNLLVSQPGFIYTTATIRENSLEFNSSGGPVRFTLEGDSMYGTYARHGRTSHVTMTRQAELVFPALDQVSSKAVRNP